MVILKEITVKNFKSFKGESKVGDVLPFTAIVGCNGAGKSNFMDAISFAMGVNTKNLRVLRMEELVHRCDVGEDQQEMSVLAVLQSSNGVVTSFERSFHDSSCQYRINDNVVSHTAYVEALMKLGINARIQNFVVFQNTIESIITKSPMDRTAMFEDISGSGSVAPEYKRLKSEVLQLKEELEYLIQNKRSILREIKKLLYCKKQAHEYSALEKKHNEEQVTLTLFTIYDIERLICRSRERIEDVNAKILELETEKCAVREELRAATKAHKNLKIEATRIEGETNELGTKLNSKVNVLLNIEEKVRYALRRFVSCQASLKSAKKAEEARNESIKQLEDALKTVKQKKDEYLHRFSETLGRDFQRPESQIEEYERLKALCSERFFEDHDKLMILERNHKSIQDELENALRRLNELQSSIDANSALRREFCKRAEKLETFIKEIESELKQKCEYETELLASLKLSKEKVRACSQELEDIRQKIGDFKCNEQIKKKNEIVKNLRRMYPGVMDRLRNLCNPVHNRYKVAVTVVLGPHLDSIVVDTSKTANLCVEYLKLREIGTETFLPLDNLEVQPLNHRLRNIRSPPNVKLLYDVIAFDPEIHAAIQFVTRNTLVAERPEHAADIAFADQNRQNCVSEDGTLHRKCGLISGGTHDIVTQVQRWDSAFKTKLVSRKAELITELRELTKGLPKEDECSILKSKIVKLEETLKYARNDLKAISAQISELEFKIQDRENDLDDLVDKREEIETRVRESSNAINQLKLEITEKEYEFFADFCRNIGVYDIRHYEDGQKLYKEAIRNFDCQISRINEQLDFERTRNIEDNVSRWQINLREAKLELDAYRAEEQDKRILIEKEKKRASDYEMRYNNITKASKETLKKVVELRRKINGISKEHLRLSTEVNDLQTVIEKNKDRHYLVVTEAKMHGLRIPLINGPPDDASVSSDDLERSGWIDESTDIYQVESNTKFDFSKLSSDLTTLESPLEIRRAREKLEKSVAEIATAMEELADPNMKASQQMQMLKEKLEEIKTRLERTRKDFLTRSREFDRVKKDRYSKFMAFFEHAVEQVDAIYKKLTRNSSAQAYLILENPEEPYLRGIHYHCVVPGKPFQSTSTLSGGEKTLAAFPLLFAAYSGDTPPFKVLDEIDASLDSRNTTKVMNYIKGNKDVQQSIVISHKKEFFIGADALIGIDTITEGSTTESRILTVDLRCWQH